MKVLIAPGHYFFTDKIGSEPLWAVEIVRAVSTFCDVDVIVGVVDLAKPLPNNVRVFPLFKFRSTNPFIEFFRRSIFYLLVTTKGLLLINKSDYQVIHHILPFSLATFNPLIVVAHVAKWRLKTLIGPIQAPYEVTTLNDLDIALVGKKINPLVLNGIKFVYIIFISIGKSLSQWMLNSADLVVATSVLAKNYYSKYTNQKIEVIPPVFNLKQPPEHAKKSTVILCVGPLVERKGQKYLIEAMPDVNRKFTLAIVGEGPDRKNLEALVRKLDLKDRVKFVGQINRQQVFNYYNKSAIFCLPSIQDSYPTVLIEALSAKLPIVATDVGSIREIVGDGGIIVKKANPQALAKALNIVMDSGLNLNSYASRFDFNVIVNKFKQIYQASCS